MCIRVNQCCCGCTLQTGTRTIGWISLLLAVICIVYYSMEISKNVLISAENYYWWIALIVDSTVWIVVSIPLLDKNCRPKLLLPYLVMGVIDLLIISIALLLYPLPSIALIANIPESDLLTADIISCSIAIIIVVAIGIYNWLVIYSYRKQLLEIETEQNSANEISML
uniref:Uncharacterized protein n=1 Tax=Daphnia galeata TaxID=27404 RepID=A0A8J2WFA5_9CRUS|nr:unnamed protein product [Daphnia galeata]